MNADSAAWKVSVAPMMDHTDRHCRYFFRLLAPDVRLYTEMVMAQAVLSGDRERLLGFSRCEHPVGVQLGGNAPRVLARAAAIAADYGYDEVNLNIGCPSDRVQTGRFGACLMANPRLVGECVRAMRQACGIPVSVKTRIGIDDHDDYAFLAAFVSEVAGAGCDTFVIHARRAILAGLSPKQNRAVPPLDYARVRQLKAEFPQLRIIINGGIRTLAAVGEQLECLDGVMIGRQAYADPLLLSRIQERYLNRLSGRSWTAPRRAAVIRSMAEYAQRAMADGTRLHHITRHLLGLYAGMPGARRWRRYLTEHCRAPDAEPQRLLDSLALVDDPPSS